MTWGDSSAGGACTRAHSLIGEEGDTGGTGDDVTADGVEGNRQVNDTFRIQSKGEGKRKGSPGPPSRLFPLLYSRTWQLETHFLPEDNAPSSWSFSPPELSGHLETSCQAFQSRPGPPWLGVWATHHHGPVLLGQVRDRG